MKIIISILVALGVLMLVGWLDSMLIAWIITQLPHQGGEWAGVARIVLWVIAACWTFPLAICLAMWSGVLTAIILGEKSVSKYTAKPTPSNTNRWQQKLDELQRKQNERNEKLNNPI